MVRLVDLSACRRDRRRTLIVSATSESGRRQFAILQAWLAPERIDLQAIYAVPFHNNRSTEPDAGMERSYAEVFELLSRLDVKSEDLVYRGVTDYVGPARVARPVAAVDDLIARARARAGSPDNPLYVIAIAAISASAQPRLELSPLDR